MPRYGNFILVLQYRLLLRKSKISRTSVYTLTSGFLLIKFLFVRVYKWAAIANGMLLH